MAGADTEMDAEVEPSQETEERVAHEAAAAQRRLDQLAAIKVHLRRFHWAPWHARPGAIDEACPRQHCRRCSLYMSCLSYGLQYSSQLYLPPFRRSSSAQRQCSSSSNGRLMQPRHVKLQSQMP